VLSLHCLVFNMEYLVTYFDQNTNVDSSPEARGWADDFIRALQHSPGSRTQTIRDITAITQAEHERPNLTGFGGATPCVFRESILLGDHFVAMLSHSAATIDVSYPKHDLSSSRLIGLFPSRKSRTGTGFSLLSTMQHSQSGRQRVLP